MSYGSIWRGDPDDSESTDEGICNCYDGRLCRSNHDMDFWTLELNLRHFGIDQGGPWYQCLNDPRTPQRDHQPTDDDVVSFGAWHWCMHF